MPDIRKAITCAMSAEGFSTGTIRDTYISRICRKKQTRTLFRGLINHLDSELCTLSIKIKPRTCNRAHRRIFILSNAHRIDSRCYLPSLFLPANPARSLPAWYSSHSFFSLFYPTRRKTLRDWIKIAGAISRTHDIGENATEALITADP